MNIQEAVSRATGVKRHRLLVFLLLLIVALIGNMLSLLFIIIAISLTYRMIRPLLDSQLFNTWALRSVVVLFIYMVILQCVILSSWLISRDFPLDMTPLLTMGVVAAICIYQYLFLRRHPSKVTSARIQTVSVGVADMLSFLIVAIILPLLLLSPLLLNAVEVNIKSLSTQASGGTDDVRHLMLFEDRLRFNRAILYESAATHTAVSQGFYPISWHAANAVIAKAIYPKISVGEETLGVYALTKVFWFSILVFLFCRITFMIYTAIRIKGVRLPVILWLIASLLLFGRYFLTDAFSLGFYNFIPQLIMALLLIPLLIWYYRESENKKRRQNTLPLIVILGIGGCLPWVLILPAFLLSITLLLLDSLKNKDKDLLARDSISGIPYNLPTYGLLLIAMSIQVYSMVTNHSNGSTSFVEGILAPGGINTYSIGFYTLLLAGLALFIGIGGSRFNIRLKYLIYTLSSILLLAGVIGIIQVSHTGIVNYYFYKVLNVFTMIALPIGLVGFGLLINYMETKKSRVYGLFTCLVLVVISVAALNRLLL